jgi:indolepyruvate ferredoxin oxidoreductase
MLHDVSLTDRLDLAKPTVLLGGVHALVRAMLMQRARDAAAGLVTAGYATGYRGSPLGGLDQAMLKARDRLAAADIRFEPGLNEDLAATALWGSQQADLRGEGRVRGVFGLWYGKGPGVDRSGDVFRHANLAGTAPLGGVIACLGDDHTGESSTTLHQSEFALVDAMMPVLSPAGVQELLAYALTGWALSRFSGLWVGLKCVKDTIEATQVVSGDPHRLRLTAPDPPPGGVSIRLHDTPAAQEARLHDLKLPAAQAFARANRLDRRMSGRPGARVGILSAGKSWLDTVHALDLLGLGVETDRLGLTTYKVGMVWPLDAAALRDWAHGLDLVVVVEEKRKLLESQLKEHLYAPRAPRVVGARDERGQPLFPATGALDPVRIARALAALLSREGIATEHLAARRRQLDAIPAADDDIAVRNPWFCSGCPHNTSTRLPEGARAYAGIGCHYMVQWMDRETLGFTHMGGEGANWIGEAPFSTRAHVFQNLGDGTYNHSGIQAIRAALAAGVNVTYKILYNDAVAMTGGQPNDGGLTPQRIAAELLAIGVRTVHAVYDPKEAPDPRSFPAAVRLHPRDRLDAVQRELQAIPGVTALIYIQTCAAEKRRRRKRGAFPDPDRRVFINPDVCEGCGDCGRASNCVSILPLDTEFGRKRTIDQSACNKDFSCLDGFCPSFVTLEGAKPRQPAPAALALPPLPPPRLPAIDRTWNLVVTGVGGTGVVTVGALIAMAAHLEGKGVGVIEMAGLAQKGGAVHIHCRIAARPADISAIRVAAGEADALIGGDLVVTAGAHTLGLTARGRTRAVVNAHETVTGDFALDPSFRLPAERLVAALRTRLELTLLDATRLAETLLGDAIFANVLLLGAAWQAGLVPLSRAALLRAIALNGAAAEGNARAFELGRWAVARPADAVIAPPEAPAADLDTVVARRAEHLVKYQGPRLARRYRARVAAARAVDPELALAVARGYHKLLAYKDEYEVARLLAGTRAAADAQFEGIRALRFHLAPPILARRDPRGRPLKREFGPWMLGGFGLLAQLKPLRGTFLDPFGYSAERRLERALIAEYERDMDEVQAAFTPATRGIALELAELPLTIRGFGHVKAAAATAAARRRDELRAAFRAGGWPQSRAAE